MDKAFQENQEQKPQTIYEQIQLITEHVKVIFSRIFDLQEEEKGFAEYLGYEIRSIFAEVENEVSEVMYILDDPIVDRNTSKLLDTWDLFRDFVMDYKVIREQWKEMFNEWERAASQFLLVSEKIMIVSDMWDRSVLKVDEAVERTKQSVNYECSAIRDWKIRYSQLEEYIPSILKAFEDDALSFVLSEMNLSTNVIHFRMRKRAFEKQGYLNAETDRSEISALYVLSTKEYIEALIEVVTAMKKILQGLFDAFSCLGSRTMRFLDTVEELRKTMTRMAVENHELLEIIRNMEMGLMPNVVPKVDTDELFRFEAGRATKRKILKAARRKFTITVPADEFNNQVSFNDTVETETPVRVESREKILERKNIVEELPEFSSRLNSPTKESGSTPSRLESRGQKKKHRRRKKKGNSSSETKATDVENGKEPKDNEIQNAVGLTQKSAFVDETRDKIVFDKASCDVNEMSSKNFESREVNKQESKKSTLNAVLLEKKVQKESLVSQTETSYEKLKSKKKSTDAKKKKRPMSATEVDSALKINSEESSETCLKKSAAQKKREFPEKIKIKFSWKGKNTYDYALKNDHQSKTIDTTKGKGASENISKKGNFKYEGETFAEQDEATIPTSKHKVVDKNMEKIIDNTKGKESKNTKLISKKSENKKNNKKDTICVSLESTHSALEKREALLGNTQTETRENEMAVGKHENSEQTPKAEPKFQLFQRESEETKPKEEFPETKRRRRRRRKKKTTK